MGILYILTGMILMKIVQERALKLLNVKEKASLIDGFSGLRTYGLVIFIAAIIFGYFLVGHFSLAAKIGIWANALAVGVPLILYYYCTYRQMKKLDLPSAYIQRWSFSSLIFIASLIVYWFLL